jgi:hypothetical protein
MSQQQYFTHYAEPEIHLLEGFPQRQYQQVVCIPAFDETPAFLHALGKPAQGYSGKVLLVLVINQPEGSALCERNQALFDTIRQYPLLWKNTAGIMLFEFSHYDILLVDRFTENRRIPVKQGVGLARKIACDIAAYLIHIKIIHTHQIFCSDADVIFPDNYFLTRLPEENSAGVLAFKHIAGIDEAINAATRLYDQSLHHYVHGLQQAGSTYAFHTIGSCLVLHADLYIQVRGFPIRPAGEDFYLLNKLNKLAPVINLDNTEIHIESRLSNRVPFGTGPAVEKLLNSENAAIFYHPACFSVLREWLKYLDDMAEAGQFFLPRHPDTRVQRYLQELVTEFAIADTVHKLFTNHKSRSARVNHLHQWFDGFKTLKAIHYCRDRHFPSMTYTELQRYLNNNEDTHATIPV